MTISEQSKILTPPPIFNVENLITRAITVFNEEIEFHMKYNSKTFLKIDIKHNASTIFRIKKRDLKQGKLQKLKITQIEIH